MSVLEIRRCRPDELEAALDLWQRSLDASEPKLRPDQRHTPEQQRAFFMNVLAVRCDLWLALRDHAPVGLLAMNADEIDRLYIDPHASRTGVGSALIDHAKRLRPTGLRLVTLQRNTPARALYERHGFTPYAEGVSPPPENEPDIWYRWPEDYAVASG